MTNAETLADFRRQLDDLDLQLMSFLLERQAIIRQVIAFKEKGGIPAVHTDREEKMLARATDIALETGLDPRIARQVLRAVIDAFTVLEVERLGSE